MAFLASVSVTLEVVATESMVVWNSCCTVLALANNSLLL